MGRLMKGLLSALALLLVGYCQAENLLIETKDNDQVKGSKNGGEDKIAEMPVKVIQMKTAKPKPTKKNRFRSGGSCPQVPRSEWNNWISQGYCRDNDRCTWVKPHETIKTVGCRCQGGGTNYGCLQMDTSN